MWLQKVKVSERQAHWERRLIAIWYDEKLGDIKIMDFKDIFDIIEDKLSVSESDLKCEARYKDLVRARVCFSLIGKRFGFSASSIARELNKDHSTVLHYLENFKNFDTSPIDSFIDGDSADSDSEDRTENIGNDRIFVSVTKPERYREAFRKAKYRCEFPGCTNHDVLEVHHIEQRKSGGSSKMYNLIVLCPTHHAMADRGMLYIKGRMQ